MVQQERARISTRLVASLLAAWREMKLDTTAIVARSSVSAERLADPNAYLSADEVQRLAVAAFLECGDPLLGLHTAEHYRPGSIPVIDYLILSAATVGQAVERYCRYDRLLQNVSVSKLEVVGERATLRHEPTGLAEPNAATSVNALASVAVFARHLTGHTLRLTEVTFTHASPTDTREYERVFDAAVHFGRAHNALVFPASYLDLPLRQTDPGVSSALQQHADALLAQLATAEMPLTHEVRQVVTALLPSGDASLEKVAARLHVGERTLRRQLRDEGITFRQVVDGVQHALACQHLRDRSLAVDEVAFLVGFSDARAFRRAFKRLQGVSPVGYRKSIENGG